MSIKGLGPTPPDWVKNDQYNGTATIRVSHLQFVIVTVLMTCIMSKLILLLNGRN